MAGELDLAVQTVGRKLFDAGTGTLHVREGEVLLPDAFIEEEIAAAVELYSRDYPQVIVEDETGNGTSFYAHSLLTSWVEEWSRVIGIEYPAAAVSASHTPTFIEMGDDFITDYRTAATRYFRLPAHTPSASETLRFHYTALHTLTNTATTIPSPHRDAVYDLAASLCCTRLAARMASTQDSVINADGTNYRDGSNAWRRMGDEFMSSYRRKLGLPNRGPKPAMAFGDWDTFDTLGQDRLTHWRRWR